jgi:BirA family biotin operon repressor/biotin-[acetyl-CoA-carboxylase] ligase
LQNNTFSPFFVGHNLVIIQQVDSTNNYLKQLLSNSTPLPEGTVIMAEAQIDGRGQQGKKWHADPGKNLTFSLLLNPLFLQPIQQFLISQIVSLGLAEVLEKILDNKISIKWPNDIYYKNNKIAGILIENTIQGVQIKNSIIGIGLNVNQKVFPSTVPNPISVSEILQRDYHLNALLSEICSAIEVRYLQLRAGNTDFIQREYLAKLYRKGEKHLYIAEGKKFEAEITGVDPNGCLIVKSEDVLKSYNLKEIAFII